MVGIVPEKGSWLRPNDIGTMISDRDVLIVIFSFGNMLQSSTTNHFRNSSETRIGSEQHVGPLGHSGDMAINTFLNQWVVQEKETWAMGLIPMTRSFRSGDIG
jgi:hypothetical protein